jgi:biopolymer transport protein ExbD
MAQMEEKSGGKQKKGKKAHKTKKVSTRVDLTPMVDLAFLLVTFFMLTTTFSKPQTMEINMPVKDKTAKEEGQAVKESKSMTIILGGEDKIFWYMGLPENATADVTDYSDKGIRKILLEKDREVGGLIVLIKPSKNSRYKNVVDILDEMSITEVKRYAIVDITDKDLELIKNI